jgi:hypothetical protein
LPAVDADAFAGGMDESEERHAISRLTERLVSRFPDVPDETVHGVVADLHAEFREAPVRAFVPLLVEHDATDRLRSMSRR